LPKIFSKRFSKGLSIIEVVIATAFFVTLVVSIVPLYLDGFDTNLRDTNKLQADMMLQQGLEAARSIRDQNFNNLVSGTYGLSRSTGYWRFSGAQDVFGKFTRTVNITDSKRDVGCNVQSSGTTDVYTKKITVTVSWNYTAGNPGQEVATEYLSNWSGYGGCEQSANLVIELSGAYLSSNEQRVAGITLRNVGSFPITIDKVTAEWTNDEQIEEVKIASSIVWKYNGIGSPDGRQSSGVELDVQNVVLPATSGVISLDHFFFTGEMEHVDFTFYVKMADGTVKYEHIDNLDD
jgi:hypothetical protein